MLQRLRQFRRRLAGTLGVLVGGTWLMLAAAPCAAAINMQMDMADHCPHCERASIPCATLESGDCELPPSLAPMQDHSFKPLAALPLAEMVVTIDRRHAVDRMPAFAATGPPHPPFTRLFCRYQE